MEVLIVEKTDGKNKIVGVQSSTKSIVDSNKFIINASFNTIQIVKYNLSRGNEIYINEENIITEVTPKNLMVIENKDPLIAAKNIALDDINNRINQNVFSMSVIDSMDYLDCMMKLMSNGIFITNENREDKYFEIIERAQSVDEPIQPDSNSSFEEEQQYIEKKREYDIAQSNLTTLEKYLNAYDKLSKIRFVNNLLNDYKERVQSASSVSDVELIVKEYCEKLDSFFFKETM